MDADKMNPRNHDDEEARVNHITEQTIGGAFAVGNVLGPGFLEKVDENALVHELGKSGLSAVQQAPVEVRYDGRVVGVYYADILVENTVIVEVKAVKALDDVHLAQCLNYLKATGLKVGLLLNFGLAKVQVKRVVNHFGRH